MNRSKQIDLTELKQIQLKILDTVAKYCRENNLRYFLAYGTLIGAVRHQGYIPWDDDIDISMPREDYESFLKFFNDNNPRYKVKSYKSDPNYLAPFAKVYDSKTILDEDTYCKYEIGINIDIFPLDGVPDNKRKADRHLNNMSLIYKLLEGSKMFTINKANKWYKNLAIYLLRLAFFFTSPQCLNKLSNKLANKYPFKDSNRVAMAVAGYGSTEIVDKCIFSSTVNLMFEGKYYSAPAQYHEYLTSLYGDYMKLPPIEEQVARHSFVCFWR